MKYLALLLLFFITTNLYAENTMGKATFAGGCFWCVESAFDELKGVKKAVSGYTGGEGENPTYGNYAQKSFVEAVEVTYDPSIIGYPELLNIFWKQIDPTDAGGQFADRGPQYRTIIYYHNDEQKKLAEKSKKDLDKSNRYDKPIITEIIKATTFYRAEDYHQNFHATCPLKYKLYRAGSGRDQYLKKIWPEKKLTPIQYHVTQENGTEPEFNNEYWNNKKEGIYVDVVSGEPLFISTDKFDSGTGWPSFTKPLEPENVIEKKDNSAFMSRTEVRSKSSNSHLGHVFNDGPKPTGLRYCMNSAALHFIPKKELEKQGYGKYKEFFK